MRGSARDARAVSDLRGNCEELRGTARVWCEENCEELRGMRGIVFSRVFMNLLDFGSVLLVFF